MEKDKRDASPLEALERIKKAEEKVRKNIQTAQEYTSQKIIQDAQQEADRIKKKVLDEAKKKAQKKSGLMRQ